MPEIFTEAWAAAWCQKLEASDAYRKAAAAWDSPMVFVLEAGDGLNERSLFLDLASGRCLGVRLAGAGDEARVPYVVAGRLEAWRGLLERRVDPMTTLLSGKLRLKKGHLFSLMPYAGAAFAMLEAAMAIDSTYPSPAPT
jgi:putative sterol carrier protein